MIKDGIGKNWTIGTQIESVAQKKFESKRPYRSKYGIGVENIQVVNDDLFDTSERLLQKKLGKLLLPPEGWTGRNK